MFRSLYFTIVTFKVKNFISSRFHSLIYQRSKSTTSGGKEVMFIKLQFECLILLLFINKNSKLNILQIVQVKLS